MEQVQIEELVAELETRVDRLRSLYEQYFMGIEKMEPLVPKKDVERRFQTMRREQIRNTALRFRFQMVLQKYNTYQSYWMRIMRQIEDGTYKRDVIRARANLADRRSTRPPPGVMEKEATALADVAKAVSDFPVDIDIDDSAYPNEAPTRKVDIPMTRERVESASFTSEFSQLDEATTRTFVPKDARALSDDEDPTGILPLIGGPAAPAKLQRPGTADPEKMRQLAARIKAGAGNDHPKVPPAPSSNKAVDAPLPAPPAPAAPAGASTPANAAAAARRPPPLPPKMKPAAGVPAIQPAPAAPPAAAKPLAPPMGVKAAPPPAPKPAPPKLPERPAAPAAQPAAAKPALPTAPAKAVNPADLPENRVRQIYTQYVETKRKQNESTTAITYEGVAKSLRESTARLKEKHGGNSVDFEVTVKDGKTILRPVLKKDAK